MVIQRIRFTDVQFDEKRSAINKQLVVSAIKAFSRLDSAHASEMVSKAFPELDTEQRCFVLSAVEFARSGKRSYECMALIEEIIGDIL